MNSSSTQPPLAVTDSFTDPDLPAGYAAFGIRVIASQVFVTYELQDAAKHDPIAGPRNGIVGNFLGKLKGGDGHAIIETALHELAFRSDGFADPDTLYFTSQSQQRK